MIEPRDLLHYLKFHAAGRVNGKPSKVIAAYFGTDERRVREAVSTLRRQRQPICSTHDHGYWYPTSRADAALGCAYITQMFAPLRQANDGFFAGLDEMFGQPNLFDNREDAA